MKKILTVIGITESERRVIITRITKIEEMITSNLGIIILALLPRSERLFSQMLTEMVKFVA